MYYKFEGEFKAEKKEFSTLLLCSEIVQSAMISNDSLRISLVSESHIIPYDDVNKSEIDKFIDELTGVKPLKNETSFDFEQMTMPLLDKNFSMFHNKDFEPNVKLIMSSFNTVGLSDLQIEEMKEIVCELLKAGILDNYEDDSFDIITGNCLNCIQFVFDSVNYIISKVLHSRYCLSFNLPKDGFEISELEEIYFDDLQELVKYFIDKN